MRQVLDDALRESRETMRCLDELSERLAHDPSDEGLLAAYGDTLETAQDHDVWDADRRADLVLDGLGLAGLPWTRALSAISGGQRGRLALGALLVRRPTALLLDEPTNHPGQRVRPPRNRRTKQASVGTAPRGSRCDPLGLIAPRDAATPVGALSVGQRSRLALAIVLADPPDLLLMDEPTNHLSPLLADELQDAFDAAQGAIVVASHDRWLRRRWDGPQVELKPVRGW